MMTDEIVTLLNKYRHHTLSQSEFERLTAWVDESEENLHYVQTYIRYYKAEERWDAYQKADVHRAWLQVRYHHQNIRRHTMMRRFSAAAACLLVLIVGSALIYNFLIKPETGIPYARLSKTVLLTTANGTQQILQNGGQLLCDTTQAATDEPVKYNTITTQQGGNFKLILPDRSVVWLNSNTTLQYPTKFAAGRQIKLEGEAFFDVTHNGYKFTVTAAGNNVQVMGTQFNVSAYPHRAMAATLIRGKVCVYNKLSRKILAPGQQAIVNVANKAINVRNVDTSIYTSWITGVFDFNDAPLQLIMEQLSEWYNLDVEYEPESLRSLHFTGSLYRDRSLDYSLDIVQFVSDVRFRKEGGKLIVYKK